MIRINEQRTIPLSIDEAFAFVADFSNVDEWDPGISSASKVGDDPVDVGTHFAVVSEFAGRSLPLTYIVEEWDPPHRVVLVTSSSRFDGRDTISFRAVEGGTEVDYVAEFDFKGVMRLVAPLLRGTFDRIGRKALDGLVAAVPAPTG